MEQTGSLLKLKTEYTVPISYWIPIGDKDIFLNDLIGKEISIEFNGKINCIACDKKIKKTYSQGYCYDCMQRLPQTDINVINPELSMAQWGISRDLEWATKNDMIPHVVYLACSSHIKVGVTRIHQIPARWIDQGATKAIKLAETPNRHIAGAIEVWLKQRFRDKTNWRSMLKGEINDNYDLALVKQEAKDYLHPELKQYISTSDDILDIEYPVDSYPKKINSISLDKQSSVRGILRGIKGQYLIFDDEVINIRKHSGYTVTLKV